MKLSSLALCALSVTLAAGCATRTVKHHAGAYQECVSTQAATLDDGKEAPETVAKLAAAQCQTNLELITEKLREENAWIEKGSNSDKVSETLRDRTIADVTAEVARKRQAK